MPPSARHEPRPPASRPIHTPQGGSNTAPTRSTYTAHNKARTELSTATASRKRKIPRQTSAEIQAVDLLAVGTLEQRTPAVIAAPDRQSALQYWSRQPTSSRRHSDAKRRARDRSRSAGSIPANRSSAGRAITR